MNTDCWKNSYYVNNEDVLALLRTRNNAKSKSEKHNVDSLLIKNLSYLVHTRVRGYKDRYYYEDALQEGIMGLMRAFNEFDPAKGPNFFLVAKWYINTYVRNFINCVCKKHENIDDSVDCDAFMSEIENAEEQYEKMQTYQQLHEAVDKLSNVEQGVINLRFGIDDNKSMTMREIGDTFLVSKQRIHQLQCSALKKLKIEINKNEETGHEINLFK